MNIEKSPDAFRTISEAGEMLSLPAHVLRFWESKFPQIKPIKRAGGRRFYRPNDILALFGIKKLLHGNGMTIIGVKRLIREKGIKYLIDIGQKEKSGRNENLSDQNGFNKALNLGAVPLNESNGLDMKRLSEIKTELFILRSRIAERITKSHRIHPK